MAGPDWTLFAAVTVLVTVAVVGLARLSAEAIREAAADDARRRGRSVTPGLGSQSGRHSRSSARPGPASRTGPGSGSRTGRGARGGTGPGTGHGSSRSPRHSRAALPSFSMPELVANVSLSHGLVGVLVVLGAWYAGVPWAALGLGPASLSAAALGVGLGVGLGCYVVDEALARLADQVGVGYSEALRGAMAPDTLPGWAVLLLFVVPLTAAVEELVFRAALIGGLAAGFGLSPWLLAVVSSLLFGAAHGAQGRAGVVVTAALGGLLAATFVLTGSLVAVVVAHTVVNALEFVVHEALAPDPRRL